MSVHVPKQVIPRQKVVYLRDAVLLRPLATLSILVSMATLAVVYHRFFGDHPELSGPEKMVNVAHAISAPFCFLCGLGLYGMEAGGVLLVRYITVYVYGVYLVAMPLFVLEDTMPGFKFLEEGGLRLAQWGFTYWYVNGFYNKIKDLKIA